MRKLVDGYNRFHLRTFPKKRALYQKLAEGQHPQSLFITCDDSRVDPLELTDANPGELFVERNIGNIVPLPESREHEAAAAIEYAVVALQVKHIVICGHARCGAMKALADPDLLAPMPTVAAWLRNAGPVRERVSKRHGHLEGEALLDALVRENVRVQVERVEKLDCVAPRLAGGQLDVHGWVFEFDRGLVEAYDADADAFLPLGEAHSYAAS